MRAYWYFEYNEVDPKHQLIMEQVIHLNRNWNKEKQITLENNEDIYNRGTFTITNLPKNNGEIWVGLVNCSDVGEFTIALDTDRGDFVRRFVDNMFNLITECICDNDFEEAQYHNREMYEGYLARHNLRMCRSKESLIEYFNDYNYLELDVKGHLAPAIVLFNRVMIIA
jgi:hypothetical protein